MIAVKQGSLQGFSKILHPKLGKENNEEAANQGARLSTAMADVLLVPQWSDGYLQLLRALRHADITGKRLRESRELF